MFQWHYTAVMQHLKLHSLFLLLFLIEIVWCLPNRYQLVPFLLKGCCIGFILMILCSLLSSYMADCIDLDVDVGAKVNHFLGVLMSCNGPARIFLILISNSENST